MWFLATHAAPALNLESCYGYLDFLQLLYQNSPRGSPLDHATTALAVFLQEAWSDLYPDSVRSREYLVRALKSINKALASPDESLKDETLVAVLLLDLHDSFSNTLQTRSPTGTHFTDGVMALIHHRGNRNYETEISKRLSIAVRHQVLSHANTHGFAVETASRIWSEADGPAAELPQNKATDLDLLSLRLNALKVKLSNLFGTSSPTTAAGLNSHLFDLFKEIEILERDFARWHDTMPAFWLPYQVENAKEFETYRGLCEVYYDLSVARVINDYRLSRATVLTWLIQLASIGGGFWVEKGLQARLKFQCLIDDVCASVPFHLGNRSEPADFDDPDCYYPTWPGQHDRNRRNATQVTAFGGLLLMGWIRGILDLVAWGPMSDPPLLRLGQQEWLRHQMLRMAIMYNFRLPPDEFDTTVPPLIADINQEQRQQEVAMIGVGWNFKV